MSTLPDFTGPGFFAGEAPDGLTTIAGTPTSASVRVYWRDPADPDAPDVLVASTQSAADGTWQIAGLNPALRYVVRAQKSQFDDVTVVGAAPSRSDVIAYVDRLEQSEEFDGLTGHVLLDSGLPPFTCQVIEPLPYGLSARIEGRKLLIEGASSDAGLWESVVRVTASNGVWVDVPVQVEIIQLFDPHWDKVVALLHFDGADNGTTFADERGRAWTAIGDAKTKASLKKWGAAAGDFNGVNSYISTPHSSNLNVGSANYTIEAWVYLRAAAAYAIFASKGDSAADHLPILLSMDGSGTKVQFGVGIDRAWKIAVSNIALPLNQWVHIAGVRSGGSLLLFQQGVLVGTASAAGSAMDNTSPLTIGANAPGNSFANIVVDDFRLTTSVARYTENFTPPDKPFPNR